MLTLKEILALFLIWFSVLPLFAQWQPAQWPVLKHYDRYHLLNIALPLGGIGTGTVSLGGRGELRDWEIMNKPAKGFSTVTKGNDVPFFAIYLKQPTGKSQTKGLIGPRDPVEYMHYEGRPVNHHGLPRFTSATFDAAYPFGQVHLADESLPVSVTIKGFNPLIPGNSDDSGIPIAVLSYEVANQSNLPVEVAVCGSIRNFIGKDGSHIDWKGDCIPDGAKNNQNEYRDNGTLKGIYMYSGGVDKNSPAWGTIALTTDAVTGVSYRRSSSENPWNRAILDFWDDFSEDGMLTDKVELQDDDPMASLSVKQKLEAGEKKDFNFYITWNFPNRYAWSPDRVGNYYCTKFQDAWDVAQKTIPRIPDLEEKTLRFVNAVAGSTYPEEVKEAALFNLSTLRSQTVFRLPDGHLMGWEGVMDNFGSCMGSCTHVWNYEQATAFLFGDLARSMRDVEFNFATDTIGLMSFRASLPLSDAKAAHMAAADGQMGTIMKFYRDWHLSGDDSFLKNDWVQVKKAISYAWIKGGWDGNQDGVMEGSQHNTMDVNYFGPNPQMQFWYFGALKAASEMAKAVNDKDFAKKCDDLFKRGSEWTDKNMFNGEYFEQKITDPETFEYLNMNDPKVNIPDYQLGKGCLVDQLVGQMMAHLCGLGYLGNKEHIQTTLRNIMKYNYLESFADRFNNMRTYVAGDESGLIMASWPQGRLKVPFPYFPEAMTGFEYTAAIGMLFENQTTNGLKCIKSVRERFDGRKRNPFDEPECGHHYARAMISWAAIPALSGFHYSGVNKTISFTSQNGIYFWSNGSAWGTCKVDGNHAELKVLCGQILLRQFTLEGIGTKKLKDLIISESTKNLEIDM